MTLPERGAPVTAALGAAPADASRGARSVDAVALARAVARLQRAPQAPWLHGEVARRMAERLAVVKRQPAVVVDWGARTGASRETLARAYPQAGIVAVDPGASAASPSTTAHGAARRWWQRLAPAAAPRSMTVDQLAAAAPGSAQLLWANMGLHAAVNPLSWMRLWQRTLAVDGFLMFSTLGPGTLQRLGALYAAEGWPAPFAPFVDMHDLGDLLVEAGFADPVMDQETLTLTWPDGASALAELRQLGANVALQRTRGLRTPRWRDRLSALLQRRLAGTDGRVALEFEIVYGHAFQPPPRVKVAPVAEVPLDQLRAMARSPRRPG